MQDTTSAYSGSCVDAMPEALHSIVTTRRIVCCSNRLHDMLTAYGGSCVGAMPKAIRSIVIPKHREARLGPRAGAAIDESKLGVCESDACVQVIHIHSCACR